MESVFSAVARDEGYLRGLLRSFSAAFMALRHRREVAALLNADSTMLRDLGLMPSDITSALAEPLWKDPSEHLLVSSRERREAARSAARDNLASLGRPNRS